jgi:hypothetical protein
MLALVSRRFLVSSGRCLPLLSCLLCACSYSELAPPNSAPACRPGAPPPVSADGPGFPCWPLGLSPDESNVHVENSAVIPASPEATWGWLTRADRWETWFSRAKNVKVEPAGQPLAVGSVVTWDMLGATIRVRVTRADAPHVLAWEGGAKGVHAYHAWVLLPDPHGTRVVTVETERGSVPALFGWTFEGRLHDAHEEWLASLARIAGSPP